MRMKLDSHVTTIGQIHDTGDEIWFSQHLTLCHEQTWLYEGGEAHLMSRRAIGHILSLFEVAGRRRDSTTPPLKFSSRGLLSPTVVFRNMFTLLAKPLVFNTVGTCGAPHGATRTKAPHQIVVSSLVPQNRIWANQPVVWSHVPTC